MALSKTKEPGTASPPGLQRRIKAVRLRLKMTQEEFAPAVGVRVKQVTRWENGVNAPAYEQLQEIARVGGVTYEWLMSGGGAEEEGASKEPYPSLVDFIGKRPDLSESEKRHLMSIDLGAHGNKGSDDYWSGVLSFYRGLIVGARAVVRVDDEVDAAMKSLASRNSVQSSEIGRAKTHGRKPLL